MSRLKRFAHSLVSGYALLAANILYTLVSVPLALHYLSTEEFGLWMLVTQVCNFNQIVIDLGMSGAVARILIDHKDDADSTAYGAVIQTGFLVLLVQGALMAVVGGLISYWLPLWMDVPVAHWHDFRLLIIWQCVLVAVAFVTRIFAFILQAHQRYDICNYANLGGLLVGLAALWAGFESGLKLYSLLVGAGAGIVFGGGFTFWQTARRRLFPTRGRWGRPNRTTFKSLFFYGADMFLVSIGQQLISASQAPVISRTLGLEAVAIWGVATKLFMLAQQLVYRLLDFSTAAFSEMMVRGEKARLQSRFRDLIVLSGSAGAAIGVTMALCNRAFLHLWTQGKLSWPIEDDILMACSLVVYTSTRCHIGLAVMTKQVGAMKYIYFAEGVAFVALGLILAPQLGLMGVILSGILTNLLFSGVYGTRRSAKYFGITVREILLHWLRPPALVFLCVIGVASGIWFLTHALAAVPQLLVGGIVMGTIAAGCLWAIGLPAHLRQEGLVKLGQVKARWFAR